MGGRLSREETKPKRKTKRKAFSLGFKLQIFALWLTILLLDSVLRNVMWVKENCSGKYILF
jgi:hypothetical protein